MKKIKERINLENILCLFIIMCPILDMASFIFRNIFSTNISPSTIIRPIIPALVMIYLFFKNNKKFKLWSLGIGGIYLIYGIFHLLVFKTAITGSSYSGIAHEAQYLVNYSFMILNLFLYIYIFRKNKNIDKLSKSVLIASSIYIVSIFISIITQTSSSTYIEGMGFKGWFESGNSIGAILVLSLFITLRYINDKKYRIFAIIITILEALFLTILLGTRVGLFGFIIAVGSYIFSEIASSFLKKKKINKKTIVIALGIISAILIVVITMGSTTLQRRKHLSDIEKNIIDDDQEAHITGSLLEIKNKIEEDTLKDGYMNEAQKKSILELYNIANKWEIQNNDQRAQQLIYNTLLVKNQKNFGYILFGNGYVANFRELVMEMEVPAILYNFGIIGFALYLMPFITISIYGIYQTVKNIKNTDSEKIMLILGCLFVFALSFFAGYVFFSSSNVMIIVVLNTLLINKIEKEKSL